MEKRFQKNEKPVPTASTVSTQNTRVRELEDSPAWAYFMGTRTAPEVASPTAIIASNGTDPIVQKNIDEECFSRDDLWNELPPPSIPGRVDDIASEQDLNKPKEMLLFRESPIFYHNAFENPEKKLTEVPETNLAIIATNIRHFQSVFWLFVFSNWMMGIAFASVTYKLLRGSKEKTFGLDTVSSHLLPSSVTAVVLVMIYSFSACLRVLKYSSKIRRKLYMIFSVVSILHYLVMLIAVPVMLHKNLSSLRISMKNALESSVNNITGRFVITQEKRECCGIDSFNDWINDSNSKFTREKIFPDSCCPADDADDICSVENAWAVGCYDIEYRFIYWYGGWFIGLLAMEFMICIGTWIQVNRLHKYLLKFRPASVT